jgi:hypothetical protein
VGFVKGHFAALERTDFFRNRVHAGDLVTEIG